MILGEGLDVHARLAPEALGQFHKRMEECYEQMRSKYMPSADRRAMVSDEQRVLLHVLLLIVFHPRETCVPCSVLVCCDNTTPESDWNVCCCWLFYYMSIY